MGTDETSDMTIQSVEKTLDVLEAIRTEGKAGVTDIAKTAGLSKSTAHYHLKTLENRGYVVNTEDGFELGVPFLGLGEQARSEMPVYKEGKEEAVELAAETGLAVQLVVADDGDGVLVYSSAGSEDSTGPYTLGSSVPFHASAAGKALAAYQSERTETKASEGLHRYTDDTVTDFETLMDQLETVREHGLAFADGERTEGCREIAAPIRTDGGLRGALAVIGSSSDLPDPWRGGKARRFAEEVPQKTLRAVRSIAGRL